MNHPRIHLAIGEGGITLCPDSNGVLRQLGFGPDAANADPEFPVHLYPSWCPTSAEEPLVAPAISTNVAGNTTAKFRFLSSSSTIGESTAGQAATRTVLVHTVDEVSNLQLSHRFELFEGTGLVAISAKLTNLGAAPAELSRYFSASPMIGGVDPTVVHFGGGWAAEWTPTIDRVTSGAKVLTSRGAVQPHLHLSPAFLLFPEGVSDLDERVETDGTVFAAMSSWTGNTQFEFHANANAPSGANRTSRCLVGMSPENAPLRLDPHESIELPETVWGWSTQGLEQLSQRLHRWIADHRVRNPERTRAIVWNNWEATGFDFDVRRLSGFVDEVAELGADLFLLDDGWFGTKFPRLADTQGLGDWRADPRKFPKGLNPLIERATDQNLRVGLWIEPEMVNPRSELYASHPDWVVRPPEGEPWQHRNQLVLDLCQPEVAEFVLDTVDQTLSAHPGVSYLKWDANRPLAEAYSPSIPPERMGEFWFRWSHAARRIMAEVAVRHPDIELMLCASGGGRVDIDALRWFHEVWPSDNTDPAFRIKMQWAMSYFFPALVTGAHVTRWGARPIDYACAVAMSARFGFDLDPAALGPEDRVVCNRAVAEYRGVAPIVQHGSLHRLVSPFRRDHSALMFTDPEMGAVVFGFQNGERIPSKSLLLRGLEPDTVYEVSAIDLHTEEASPAARRNGADLMDEGLWWPLSEPETAVIWRIKPAGPPPAAVIDLTG